MKKIYTLIPLIFTAFVSTSALAATDTCTLNLVKEDGNFAPSDYGPGGMVTYDVVMPFTDGYYPNWTTSQPKPRLSFNTVNCRYWLEKLTVFIINKDTQCGEINR
jgi:hypothetical protein